MRGFWLQSDIARWRWLPRRTITPGAVFPDEKKYRPSTLAWHWGRWILAREHPLYEYDVLPEGEETTVNGHPCKVRHWTFKRLFPRPRGIS